MRRKMLRSIAVRRTFLQKGNICAIVAYGKDNGRRIVSAQMRRVIDYFIVHENKVEISHCHQYLENMFHCYSSPFMPLRNE